MNRQACCVVEPVNRMRCGGPEDDGSQSVFGRQDHIPLDGVAHAVEQCGAVEVAIVGDHEHRLLLRDSNSRSMFLPRWYNHSSARMDATISPVCTYNRSLWAVT